MALLGASHLLGATAPSLAMKIQSKIITTTSSKLSAVDHVSISGAECKQTSDDLVLSKTHNSFTKFRQLAGIKRGKNRILLTNNVHIPVRSAFLATIDSNIQTQVDHTDLLSLTHLKSNCVSGDFSSDAHDFMKKAWF